MRAWTSPDVPRLPVVAPPVRVHDTSVGALVASSPDGPARMYVCGITPYDATHLGHAATYVAFDLLGRAWRSAGHEVRYVQNVTDVDDPLLERADATGEDWVALAERETELFRTDMEALRVIAPDAYVGAVEAIPLVVTMVQRLQRAGARRTTSTATCTSPSPPTRRSARSPGGTGRRCSRSSASAAATPTGPGKKDPLDCLLWQAERPGEPAWDSPFGRGRPGWHVECSAIAREHLGAAIDVQGGGSDLVFPHHEMSASEAQVAEPGTPFARAYVHAGMVALDGEKMSKSKGNLVLRLAAPRARHRPDGDPAGPAAPPLPQRLGVDRRRPHDRPAGAPGPPPRRRAARPAPPPRRSSRRCWPRMAEDLDAPTAVDALTTWAAHTVTDTSEPGAGDVIRVLADAALGLEL